MNSLSTIDQPKSKQQKTNSVTTKFEMIWNDPYANNCNVARSWNWTLSRRCHLGFLPLTVILHGCNMHDIESAICLFQFGWQAVCVFPSVLPVRTSPCFYVHVAKTNTPEVVANASVHEAHSVAKMCQRALAWLPSMTWCFLSKFEQSSYFLIIQFHSDGFHCWSVWVNHEKYLYSDENALVGDELVGPI